jgi:hypothetical protein
MTEVATDTAVRHAIGGDADAVAWIIATAVTTDDVLIVAMAAVLEGRPDRLGRGQALATTSRDRQLLAIVGAHLDGQRELVDALARDHLVDHPDSLIVAWIAAGTPIN